MNDKTLYSYQASYSLCIRTAEGCRTGGRRNEVDFQWRVVLERNSVGRDLFFLLISTMKETTLDIVELDTKELLSRHVKIIVAKLL